MTFRLFLLCSFVLLARPQDILTFLQPMRLALVLTLLSMAAMILDDRRRQLAAALSTTEGKRYALFFAIMLLGIPFAYHRRIAFEGVVLLYTANVIYFYLVLTQVSSVERLKRLMWVICLSTFVYSIFGGLLEGGSGERFQVRLGGYDPNDTAYVLLSLFPLCLYFVQFGGGWPKRLIALAATCGAIAVILLTGSRGGILGLGAIVLVLFLRRAGGIGAAQKTALAFALVAAWLLLGDRLEIERYLSLKDISTDYNVTSEGGRMELWEAAIVLSLTNPLTGVGMNCFSWAHLLSRVEAGDAYLAEHVVHNSYLQIAVDLGLIGFAVYLLMTASTLLTFLRISRARPQPDNREIRALAGLLLLGYVGLLVSGFFLSQGYSIFATLYFALAASLRLIHERGPAASAVRLPAASAPAQGEYARADERRACPDPHRTGYRRPS